MSGTAIPAAIGLSKLDSLQMHLQARSKNTSWEDFLQAFETNHPREAHHCNLPPRDYTKFIGRETELKKLLSSISPNYRQHIAIVEGSAGIGKTSLVLEAAHRCWQARQSKMPSELPSFDAIIFTSVRQSHPETAGRLNCLPIEEALQDIFRVIALELDDPTIIRAATDKQLKLIYERLRKQRTLLIIDNLEALDNQNKQEVLSFLANLPNSTQAIITTLERVVLFSSIQLSTLSEIESIQLIQQQAEIKKIEITSERAQRIYYRFGGIPIALIYVVGQRAMGYSFKRILNPSAKLSQDIARFCFEGSIRSLRKQPAYRLLMSLAIFQTAASLDAVAEVASLKDAIPSVQAGLDQLQTLSLVQKQEERYSMLPITRNYVLAELTTHLDFEVKARERWVSWHQNFAQQYGEQDWKDWRDKYDCLAQDWQNITSVLCWCAAHDRYEDVKRLWQSVDTYVDLEGDWRSRGYWWKWLEKESNRRADLSIYVKALSEQGWLLVLMGRDYRMEAARVLKAAWKLKKYADLDVQLHLLNYITVHRTTRGRYRQALKWIGRGKTLLNGSHLEHRGFGRHQVWLIYNQSEVEYQQGNYDLARKGFSQVIEQAERIGWQRFGNYAQNWLAEVAIDQNKFDEAESILQSGLSRAQQNRERRRIALYEATFARLEIARGHTEEARKYAASALEFFVRDGMQDEAKAVQSLFTFYL